jgi:hypothetical protein
MKKETIKEVGKLFLDLSKIIFAVAIVAPLMKDGDFQIIVVILALLSSIIGIYLTNKGA